MVSQEPQVAVVDFHHARGPEVEFWVTEEGTALYAQNDWQLLPFMALSDGAHTSVEDFSYFTLLRKASGTDPPKSLFGMSCTRQISSKKLKNASADVTRSTVQKCVIVLTDEAHYFGRLKERLSAVTNAWFAQEDFSNIEILKEFQESLSKSLASYVDESDYSLGLSLREIIHEFKNQTLVLFKCLLLQRKMLFFGSRCERICKIQFSLISLIPGLTRSLQDCADPALDAHAQSLKKATSLRTSDRNSVHAYMGLPLQIFGKGSFFSPYTPLQQLDILADYDTKSYVVGSTNSLLLQQKDKYSDLLVNLDESNSITINSPSLRAALSLSAADRRWIDFLTQTVYDTWDPGNPSRPRNMGYAGSEEFIRLQFEEYLLALLSSTAYQIDQAMPSHLTTSLSSSPSVSSTIQRDPSPSPAPSDPTIDFNPDFLHAWRSTNNFTLFNNLTCEARIYDIIEPRHPTAGGLSVDDIQRRVTQQVADLHLDERVREGRELVNKHLASGRERMGRLWADIEARRKGEREGTGMIASAGSSTGSTIVVDDGSRKESTTTSSMPSSPSSNKKFNLFNMATLNRSTTTDAADSSSTQPTTNTTFSSSSSSSIAAPPPQATTTENLDSSSSSTTTSQPPNPNPNPNPSSISTSTFSLNSLRDRASRVQLPPLQRPAVSVPAVNTAQLSTAARENAAKAGAYLSSWGSWAKERATGAGAATGSAATGNGGGTKRTEQGNASASASASANANANANAGASSSVG